MQSVAEQIANLPPDERAQALSKLSDAEAEALLYDWRGFLARPDQIAPDGEWDIWLCLAGRGWGKTRTGAEWVKEQVENNTADRIALVAETAADARDVMVAELLRIFPKHERPVYTKSTRSVEFYNGAKAFTYNAVEPDQLRGPQHSAGWLDEIAKWRYARETFDQFQFGLRLGSHPRQIITTTPRPIELIKAIVGGQEGKVHVTRGSTMDNRANLASSFLERIQRRYAGTRLGRQELNAEILGDLPGAIWSQSVIDTFRVSEAPEVGRTVVAVDPAVTNTEESDEHGIIVAGIGPDQAGYVLEDASRSGSPADWAREAVSLYHKYSADGIVVEVNQGGDMVAHTIRTIAPNVNIIEVRASKGKHVRAEPIAALYEQGRVRHVGQYPELEAQMTQFTTEGYQGDNSPDRVDALVWAFTDLFTDMVETVPDVSRFYGSGRSRGFLAT
ncbi:terminase family protein [Halocynthiibacter sp. C4]|uniref:DNA-packaging protein n=1 Tax=Halocynthiibacter sp. C4 TaxID=2992758 RepID=UPI00237C3AA4|nr:terminase family protein [Halocynthiibacter sp. C4]MDE0590427.1 terminase family protein [Halocynthiibacter sp. C4]